MLVGAKRARVPDVLVIMILVLEAWKAFWFLEKSFKHHLVRYGCGLFSIRRAAVQCAPRGLACGLADHHAGEQVDGVVDKWDNGGPGKIGHITF